MRKVIGGRWSPHGEVVCELDGERPMVIWQGIPGERARVRVDRQGRNQIRSTWMSAHPPDPHRVAPPCDRYDRCGGCPLMHLDGDGQVLARQALVRGALDEVGLDIEVGPHHPSPDGLARYRTVAKVGFGVNERGRIRVGAWGRGGRDIVPIPGCLAVAPVLTQTMKSLAHHTIELDIPPYNAATDHGVLRAAVMRASRTTGNVLLTLVAGRRSSSLIDLANAVGQGVPEVIGTWVHLNSDPGNNIFSRNAEGEVRVSNLAGREWIEERLGSVTYRIGPGDFFQTNPGTAAVLYERVLARLDPGPDDAVVDLYCGVGGIALQAAPHCAWVVGVEEVEGAVLRAKGAARQNRLRAEFLSRRVLDAIPELRRRLGGARPLVAVNPARRGLEDGVVDAIVGLSPRRVVYVSCNPRAMARDLAAFAQAGLRPGPVELFDMFPNTAHVECVVGLEGSDAVEGGRRAPRRKVVRTK